MKRLVPLILSPSAPIPSSPGLPSASLPVSKMAGVEEPATDCNFPELLARDLEISGAIFASKSMTAGCPLAGLASSDVDDGYAFQGPEVPRRPMSARPASAIEPHSHPLILSRDEITPASSFGHEESRYADELSDTTSESSAGMGPPPVRTREQSFTTAATSVSGRCSSLLSNKPVSPTSRIPPKADHNNRHGTWFDNDADSEPHALADTTSDEIGARAFLPPSRSTSGFIALSSGETFPLSPNAMSRPFTANASQRAPTQPAASERPHTSSGQPRIERPRIIEIQPLVSVPKRKSSLKRTHSEPSQLPAVARSTSTGRPSVEEMRCYGGPLSSHPPMPLLATACGRTVIDASKPPSFDSDEPEYVSKGLPTAGALDLHIDEGFDAFMLDERRAQFKGQAPNLGQKRKPSLATVGSWADSNAEVFAPRASSGAPAIAPAGIPLPPDVVETLRVSIVCFPETMLLTSCLSIDTIRAYSRKLKHRSATPQHRLSEDGQSVFSFSSGSTKQANRWGLPKLMHSRRARKHSQQSSLVSTQEGPTGISRVAVTPNWTPIKNIFTTGSDYLCDALYAHLIAYNYINTLCPFPSGNTAYGIEDKPTPRVPRKAASILGLQAASAEGCNTVANPLLRRMNSRRMKGSGSSGNVGSELTVLRDLQIGLGRCIAFLVSTLKRSGEDIKVEEGDMGLPQFLEAEAVDPLLMRSLCEVVRCSEEAISGFKDME